MKQIWIVFVLMTTAGHAQKVEKQIIKTEVDEVKLFLTAGEMAHHEKVTLKKGRNRLVFTGISAYADPQSIQFVGEGNYRLVSVSTEMDFLAAEQFNPEISVLKDSLENLSDAHQNTQDILDSYLAEQAVLNTNRDLGGNSQNITVAQIKEAGEFYRKRTLEINQAITKLKKEKRRLSETVETLRFQLVELNYNENQRSNQVVVLLDSDETKAIETSLKYLVSDCGWAATYDLSAIDINQKINLKYKAQVYNNTGNDWKDVVLTLSTGDPNLSASHPELSPWYLNYYTAAYSETKSSNNYYSPQAVQQDYRQEVTSNINIANQRAYDNYYTLDDTEKMNEQLSWNKLELSKNQVVGNGTVQMRQIEISELTTEFKIEHKFSCPTDAKPYMVNVKEMDLDATFSHITVPKLDKAAFLMANIVGWQDLDLIPGPTNVYFAGVYVGMSDINTRNVSDTLSLSFGRDNKVVVMRKLKKELSSKKIIGSSKKESYIYEVAIRNNRSTPINIKVYDQIPISNSTDISVTVDELSGGVQDITTGEVKWNLTISSMEVQAKEIGYTVKYPKSSDITIQTFRTVSCPSF
jgi:prefoldin subunit 5